MNLVLFEAAEIGQPLLADDPRVRHVRDVLRRPEGDTFDAGIVDGPRGKGRLRGLDATRFVVEFAATGESPAHVPITLLVGLPRPQTARDILRDATTLGVAGLHFVATAKGDPNYARSSLWWDGEWRRHLRLGAEQAFSTRLPEVTHGQALAEALDSLAAGSTRIALDNYEAQQALSRVPFPNGSVCLAIGAERGWSAEERERLRAAGFVFAHLGDRVLRTETACIAAITLVKSRLGLM